MLDMFATRAGEYHFTRVRCVQEFNQVGFAAFLGDTPMIGEVNQYRRQVGDTQAFTTRQETSTACLDLYRRESPVRILLGSFAIKLTIVSAPLPSLTDHSL